MINSFNSMVEYLKAFEANQDLVGPSPGGAAAAMHCTRQYVSQLENEGKIDTVRVYQKGRWWKRELIVLMVTQKSLERYVKEHRPELAKPPAKK